MSKTTRTKGLSGEEQGELEQRALACALANGKEAMELDFLNEAKNSVKCMDNFRRLSPHIADYVYAPTVYWSLSTTKVLTMEFIEGAQVNDLKSIQKLGIQPHDIQKLIVLSIDDLQEFVHPGRPDLRTTIELITHFTIMLKILTSAPADEPTNYVSIWFKVISACFQELKHGTWIWKRSVEKNVHREILSKRQGKLLNVSMMAVNVKLPKVQNA